MEVVQKDVGLTDDQLAAVKKLQEELRPTGGRPQGQPSDEERQKLREQFEARATKERDELAKILKPEQQKRLTGIYVQQAGTAAIGDPEVSKELGISDEQKAKLRTIREETAASMRGLFGGGEVDREANRTKFNDLRKSSEEKVLAVLSDDQKKKLEELKGKKIDLPEGGGRGRGRPNNN